MTKETFENLLLPSGKVFQRETLYCNLIKAVNKSGIAVLVISLIAIAINGVFALFAYKPISAGWHLSLIALALIIIFIIALVKGLRKPALQKVALRLDSCTNKHNEISNAYDLVCQNRETAFAQLTILLGITQIHRIDKEMLAGTLPAFNKPIILIASLVLSLSFAGFPVGYLPQKLTDFPSDTAIATLAFSDLDYNKPLSSEGKKANVTPALNEYQAKFANGSSAYSGSDTIQGSAGQASQDSVSQQMMRQSQKELSAIATEQSREIASPGKAGSSQSPATETTVASNQMISGAAINDDQQEANSADKQGLPSSSNVANLPFLDDRSAAPGRELGRSGKKGKPGSGRGGIGSAKKSRATAAILSGEKIKVFVKSRQGNGRSKSFLIKSPPGQLQDYSGVLANGKTSEGFQVKRAIDEPMEVVTKKYFEELNKYANRMFTTGK